MLKMLRFAVLLALLLVPWSGAQSRPLCHGGRAIHVAIFQGGTMPKYRNILSHMISSLIKSGDMSGHDPGPRFNPDRAVEYAEFARGTADGCVVMLPDGYYNAEHDDNLRGRKLAELLKRIDTRGDIDMIWAFGTEAGLDLGTKDAKVPVLVIGTNDPEGAGISVTGEYSAYRNVHVGKLEGVPQSELELFHRIFRFNTMGVLFDREANHQKLQAKGMIESFAMSNNIKLNICYGDVIQEDALKSLAEVKRCILELAEMPGTQAVYIPTFHGFDALRMQEVLEPLIRRELPSMIHGSTDEVRAGALMALALRDMRGLAEFEADVVRMVAAGRKPESIPQYFRAPPYLSLNLTTAMQINWKPPFDVLVAVDEVYHDYQLIEER